MKEKLLKFAIAFWVVLIPSLLLVVATKDTFVDVDVAQPEIEDSLGGGAYSFLETTRSAGATTTRNYLNSNAANTASTTAVFKIDKTVDLDLNFVVLASSTASRLVWAVAFSNNYTGACSTANAVCTATGDGDWFFEDGSSVDSTTLVTHGAGRLINEWRLNASSTESCGAMCFTKNVGVPDTRATHMKLYLGSQVADASVWFELMRQVPLSR